MKVTGISFWSKDLNAPAELSIVNPCLIVARLTIPILISTQMLLLGLHTSKPKRKTLVNLVDFSEALWLTVVKAECECTAQQQRQDRNLLGSALCMDMLAGYRHACSAFSFQDNHTLHPTLAIIPSLSTGFESTNQTVYLWTWHYQVSKRLSIQNLSQALEKGKYSTQITPYFSWEILIQHFPKHLNPSLKRLPIITS